MTLPIPRLRGRTGQAMDGEYKDKWFYEITLWDFTGEQQIGHPFQVGPFDDEGTAFKAGKDALRKVAEGMEKNLTGKSSGKFMDMKNGGVVRPWEDNA